MEIVKKNILSIIFGVIAIVAVVAAFYPMNGKFEELKTEAENRAKKHDAANAIINKQRFLPVVSLTSTEQPALGIFPAPKVTDMAKKFMDTLISQSRGVLEAAVQINQAECVVGPKNQLLLVPGSLPEPQQVAGISFKNALQPEYDRLLKEVLVGAYPPQQEDITRAAEDVKTEWEKQRKLGADGQAINEQAIQEEIQKQTEALPEKLKTQVAAQHLMYVDPDGIATPKDILMSPQSPRPEYIWFAQATLWVQEDVCRALRATNDAANAKNVMTAPVKRLVSLTVPPQMGMYLLPMGSPDSGGGAAAPVEGSRQFGGASAAAAIASQFPPNNNPPQPVFTLTPTGRVCNSLYDVINFTLVVHVDQQYIPKLLKELSHNRFISVRKMDVRRLDNKEQFQQGFAYGDAPVAEVTMDCEAIQMREWTVPLMPRAIKDLLIGQGVEYAFQLKPNAENKQPQ
jgi:hypothetical protein